MKKFFSLLTIFTIFGIFIAMNGLEVNAEEAASDVTCDAKVVLHYHRFDETYDVEFWTWDTGTGGSQAPVAITDTDDFGGVAEFTICSDAADTIGLIPRSVGSWDYKDGTDGDDDGTEVDNKSIDVSDIKGTNETKHVYLLQGSSSVYYQDPTYTTNFGAEDKGSLVVVYYNPTGHETANIWTWSTDATNDKIDMNYSLGLDGPGVEGGAPDLFGVAVINVGANAEDQIGFIPRLDDTWDKADRAWASDYTEDWTDENGHTYVITSGDAGNRLINVSDIKGTGYKFIYVINGNPTIYEDFDQFKAEAFKLEFTKADFKSKTALQIKFNQEIQYEEGTGPDISKFELTDENGNVMTIKDITYDIVANPTSGSSFYIVLDEEIEDKDYTLTYNFTQFGEEKSTTTDTTIPDDLFPEEPAPQEPEEEPANYTWLIIVGAVVVVGGIAGAVIALSRKK